MSILPTKSRIVYRDVNVVLLSSICLGLDWQPALDVRSMVCRLGVKATTCKAKAKNLIPEDKVQGGLLKQILVCHYVKILLFTSV